MDKLPKFIATASGSVYELDDDNKRVRRLTGIKPPKESQGVDGQWKSYEVAILTYHIDGKYQRLAYSWKDEAGIDKTTYTAPIKAAGDKLADVVQIN